jgi:transposase
MGSLTACTLYRTHCGVPGARLRAVGLGALQRYDFLVLFPINPNTLANYREAFALSHAKDDPTDAECALGLLLRHRDRLKPLQAGSVPLRTLAALVEQRRSLVDDQSRLINRVSSALKQYYPQALDWFRDRVECRVRPRHEAPRAV